MFCLSLYIDLEELNTSRNGYIVWNLLKFPCYKKDINNNKLVNFEVKPFSGFQQGS